MSEPSRSIYQVFGLGDQDARSVLHHFATKRCRPPVTGVSNSSRGIDTAKADQTTPSLCRGKGCFDLATGEKRMSRRDLFVLVTVTAAEVGEIAEQVDGLPEDFDPAVWLAENRTEITIVATEAVKDVIYEALEIGLADHPLILPRQIAENEELG